MNFKKCSFLSLHRYNYEEIWNNLLHLSRVMTRPVQYTYNRCQFVTRSWFIYAIRWARLLLPGFPLPTYSSNKNCTFIHYFTCTILVYWGKCIVCCKFQGFFCLNFFKLLLFLFTCSCFLLKKFIAQKC